MQNRLGVRHMKSAINVAILGIAVFFMNMQNALAETSDHAAHAEDLHAVADGHHEAASSGLPQLDPSTYPSQIFWLVISFVLLYIYFSSKTLPEMSSVLEDRQDRITNDLTTAEELKNEIETAQITYEKSLGNARDKATQTLTDTGLKIAEKASQESDKFGDMAEKEITALEKEIEKAKGEAMESINSIVAEVSHEAAQKIVGLKLDLKKAQTVVKALNQKKAA